MYICIDHVEMCVCVGAPARKRPTRSLPKIESSTPSTGAELPQQWLPRVDGWGEGDGSSATSAICVSQVHSSSSQPPGAPADSRSALEEPCSPRKATTHGMTAPSGQRRPTAAPSRSVCPMSWNLQAGGRQRAHQSGEIAPTSGARDGSDGGNRADKQQGGGDRANASGGRREALAAPADGARPHMKEDKLKRTHHARSE
jgi:hypothetical protein